MTDAAYFREYREKNRERLREKARQDYEKNRERRKATARKSYAANIEKRREDARARYHAKKDTPEWRASADERSHRKNLKAKFNLTPEQYAEMLEAQGGVCAVCRRAEKNGRRLAVDHDHETGEVRGLLCAACNTSIGQMNEDPELLRVLADYIESFRLIQTKTPIPTT